MNLILIKKIHETEDIVTFLFKQSKDFIWKAGQYLRYTLPHLNPDNRGYKRYFTISTAPYEKIIGLTTRFAKEKGSTFKKALYFLELGNTIQAENLQGEFIINNKVKKYVFIAGGIGITPFSSILLQLDYEKKPINVTMLYANRNRHFVFKDELESLTKNNPRFKIKYFTDNVRIDEKIIKSLISKKTSLNFYVSGPAPMVFTIEDMLKNMGIENDRIKLDDFPGYTQI